MTGAATPRFDTRVVPTEVDAIAPDGSEIRLLATGERASMVHCTLPPGATSRAIAHRQVEELWFFLSGQGEVWRSVDGREDVTGVTAGSSLDIPTSASFQFRNTGDEPLRFVIVTTPPWPGDHEALPRPGRWPTD